jgi:hypothetical protein
MANDVAVDLAVPAAISDERLKPLIIFNITHSDRS